jgi:glycosyltransferase involved in cell wall biosynthesis
MTKHGSAVKILQIGKFFPPYAGGMETHLEDLSAHLSRVADVRVIVSNTDRRSVTERVAGVTVHRAGTIANVSKAAISPGMVSAIRRSPAHLVHIHWPNPTAVLAYLASGHTGKLIFTYHSDIVRQRIGASLFRPILKRVLARCSAIICTSRDYADTSVDLRPVRHLCRVVPYGIATEKFDVADPVAVESLRQRYGPRIVLAVGRLVYYKGFEYLIRAMKSVDARAVIVGDGPLRDELRSLAVSCGVSDRVVFAGEISGKELVSYLHAADVFALPSVARSEAFGIVQLEAMACGKPVINTSLDSGVPSVSLDGITGLTVPPADSDALAAAINKLIGNEDLRYKYGQAGRMRIAQEFTVEKMAERTLQIYRNVLQSAPVGYEHEKVGMLQHARLSRVWDETSL